MYVPAGQHTIEMRFDPTSLHVTEGIAYGALALLVIAFKVTEISRNAFKNNKKTETGYGRQET